MRLRAALCLAILAGGPGAGCEGQLGWPCSADEECRGDTRCVTDEFLQGVCTRSCEATSDCEQPSLPGLCDQERGYCFLPCITDADCRAGTTCSSRGHCMGTQVDPVECTDADGDGHVLYHQQWCPWGDDHCDGEPHNWTASGCALCTDLDGDGRGTHCDAGGDCDDADPGRFLCTQTGWAQVSAGARHSCATHHDGRVWCWGANGDGQLGDGTDVDRLYPVEVSGLADGVAVSAGAASHACAVLGGGELWCWGDNLLGQLGDGTNAWRSQPVAVVGLGAVTGVAAGGGHTCALADGGRVWCWGSSPEGALGQGSVLASFSPVAVGEATGFAQVAAGLDVSCAVTTDGTALCWGSNPYGQLGDGTVESCAAPTPVGGLTDVQRIATHDAHTCAITGGGDLYCWGANFFGQLGLGTTDATALPTPVGGLSDVVDVAVGAGHSCGVRGDGTVWCWGRNATGALGDGTWIDHLRPEPVEGLSDVASVAAGDRHTCAVTTGGAVWCWGANWSGQLGDGTTVNRSVPVPVVFP